MTLRKLRPSLRRKVWMKRNLISKSKSVTFNDTQEEVRHRDSSDDKLNNKHIAHMLGGSSPDGPAERDQW